MWWKGAWLGLPILHLDEHALIKEMGAWGDQSLQACRGGQVGSRCNALARLGVQVS